MRINVLIKITGLHAAGGEDGDMELIVNGTYMKNGEKVYLSYDETDSDGVEYKCRIRIEPGQVVYSKTGMFTTELYYVMGEPYESVISTPYGQLDAEIITERLELRDNPAALTDLSLDYRLSINGEHATECKMCILVEEIGKYE